MNQKNIVLIVAVIVLGGVGYFVWQGSTPAEPTPIEQQTATNQHPTEEDKTPSTTVQMSGKIDEHLTINDELRDVNFCGKTYKVKQVMIDGVDVVQRIAEIARKNTVVKEYPQYEGTGAICSEIAKKYKEGEELKVGGYKMPVAKYDANKDIDYSAGIDFPDRRGVVSSFSISISKNIIYQSGEEAGDFVTRIPIGSFKK